MDVWTIVVIPSACKYCNITLWTASRTHTYMKMLRDIRYATIYIQLAITSIEDIYFKTQPVTNKNAIAINTTAGI
jgi:hypothetical protein